MNRLTRTCGVLLLAIAAGCHPPLDRSPGAGVRPVRTVVLISLDGATPRGIAAADTPNIDRLIALGAMSRNARTITPYKTLPCHTSMLTGVEVARHGVTQNSFSQPLPVPAVSTVFDHLDRAGKDALMIVGKYKLLTLRSGHFAPLARVGSVLRRETRYHVPDFVFLHSAEPDVSGHADGWESPGYLQAIHLADAMVGEAIDWLHEKNVWDDALVIISADHGGHEKTHTGEHPDDVHIPWIASGGALRECTLPDGLEIHDIAPTVLHALDLPVPLEMDGSVVTALWETATK
ncbi:MAG: sulfatase-like hydrolase/transferase [bacterium]|nr:sulfatase-like hydrolase/transferase [bacterium]